MNPVRYPNGNVLLRNLNRDFPIISHGEGPYLYDQSGRKYFDGSGGALVVSAGHGNREISQKIFEQLSKVAYVNGTQFTSQAAERLATQLAQLSPDPDLNRACFLNSGSEAVEAAVKFARQLWVERRQLQRAKIIARVPSYHGNTLYALSASARPHYKKYYGPLLHDVVTVPAPYEYRSQVSNFKAQGGEHYARLLEEAILREGPDSIAAFIVEPVIGSSAGASVPPPGYFERVQEICRKHGILIIADEIMCGAGRTGKFFASEHFGLKPDILLLGKGVSSGYIPLSVVMVRDSHLQEMKAGTGYFMHAQTYLQAPSMAAAGLATLEYFEAHGLVENSAKMGVLLQSLLHEALDAHPHVGFITGKGLFVGIEFVEDKKTKKPFDRSEKLAESLIAHAFDLGLIVWPNIGQADGVNGDLIMLGPPLTCTESQVRELAALVEKAVTTFEY
jgi:adenosylmethionine-8-amino-7-oxononanoate aminotransferase